MRIVWLVALVPLALGCDTGPRTYPVRGSVTWNGTPVETGTVTFLAADGSSAPAVARIVGGRYETAALPGPKRVEVHADVDAGFDEAMGQRRRTPLIPPDFNAKSKLAYDVTASPDNSFDLHLAKPAK